MSIKSYTTEDDVRAILGVSSDELGDETLALEVYESNLLLELEDVNANLQADYFVVTAIAVGSRTATESKFHRTLRLFAAYAVARQLISSLPLFGPKDISDGKAMVSRFSDSPYKETIKEVRTQYDKFRVSLTVAYGEYKTTGSTAYARPYLSVSSPSTDPVTGA